MILVLEGILVSFLLFLKQKAILQQYFLSSYIQLKPLLQYLVVLVYYGLIRLTLLPYFVLLSHLFYSKITRGLLYQYYLTRKLERGPQSSKGTLARKVVLLGYLLYQGDTRIISFLQYLIIYTIDTLFLRVLLPLTLINLVENEVQQLLLIIKRF